MTEANKREYVDLVAEHRMTTAIRQQIQAFLKGFWDMVPKVRARASTPFAVSGKACSGGLQCTSAQALGAAHHEHLLQP